MSYQTFQVASWGARGSYSENLPHPWLTSLFRRQDSVDSPQVAPYLTAASRREIQRLGSLQYNWDGSNSAAPEQRSVSNALLHLDDICELSMHAGRWIPPHISVTEDGEITFEWWKGERKATLFFGSHGMQLLLSWGTDLENEMDIRHISKVAELAKPWAWLHGY